MIGTTYYGTYWGDMPFKREMGETYEDMKKAAEYQKNHPEAREYAPSQEARDPNFRSWEDMTEQERVLDMYA